jgi:trimeric autotransporter adhesin
MALVLKDRVLETSTSTGTGAFALGGAQTGFQSFSVIGSGNTTYYTIQGKNADGSLTGEWEVGVGTYTTGSLARTTVLESSNANSLVVFSAGSKDVFCDLPAEKVLSATGTSSQLLANDGSGGLSNVTIGSNLTYSAGTLSATGGGGMTYPGAGIANSTGSAWGTSYGVSGTGSVALTSNPVFSTDITVNGNIVGKGAANVDNLAFGNGALSNAAGLGTGNIGIGPSTLSSLTDGLGNIALGYYAMSSLTTGNSNIGIGVNSLPNNSTGSNNVAIGNVFTGIGNVNNSVGIGDGLGGTATQTTSVGSGVAAIANATDSVFFGYNVVNGATNANQSVIIGSQAFGISSGTVGAGSIAIGYQASYSGKTAIQTAIGYQACFSATFRGNGCTAIGYQSLYSNGVGAVSATLSTFNTVVGYKSLYANTTGSNNTALGYQSGWGAAGTNANTTGSNNTYIGYQTIGSASTNSNETVIGASAVGLGSNTLVLGNSSVGLTQLRGAIYGTNYTVATLPSATVGAHAFVTDALAPAFGTAVVGGGSVAIPVYYNGTNWLPDAVASAGGSGTVTSVSGTGTVNGLTLTGTVTSSGNLTLGGTLDLSSPPAIGGTAASTGAFTYISTSSSTSTTPTLSFNASNSPYAAGATISGSYLQHMLQNKSATAGASTNYVLSNDSGTDSTFYGEFGMNSSVFSASTPADYFSINNGVYFSAHDGDITVGSGNGYKTYLAWGTTGQSAHVINASGAIGLNTNLGTTPALSGTTNFGTSGQVLQSAGSAATPTWSSALNSVSIGATTASTGRFTGVTVTAGTASIAPILLTSGTNLTSATAGAIEYDGVNFYATAETTSGRNVVPEYQQFYLSSNVTAFGPASGDFFGATSSASLAATTSYDIECYCYFLKSTAGTAQWIPTFSTALTVGHSYLEYTPVTGFTTTLITGAMVVAEATQQTTTVLTHAATASLTTAVSHIAKLKIRVLTNTACNFRLKFVGSAGTITPQAGSWYTVRKVASNAGNFVA